MREKKGYALKRSQGLVPFKYDTDSRRFHQGAWKNWTRHEVMCEGNRARLDAYDQVMQGR